MRMRQLLLMIFLAVGTISHGQTLFTHVEPPYWWTGMSSTTVQVLFHSHGADLSKYTPSIQYPGVVLKEVNRVENPRYVILTLELSPETKAGSVPIVFRNGKKSITYSYVLKEKSTMAKSLGGFGPADVVYLIMPDRFSNGDPANDSIQGMHEGAHRENPEARHGGDLKGIENHLDYISDLGVTSLWLNPVLENNQRRASYHGYAITDLYKVDRRFGSNEEYVSLIEKCHARGLKVIQDMVMNHIGSEHWLMHDLPEKNWIHQFPQFTRSNYRGTVRSDPYRSEFDLKRMNDGWFDTTMPDVDQTNPLFATYLIQNTIWWIGHAGLDGIRMDTYPYPDKDFMAQWCKAVMAEFPSTNLVGEVWINDVATTAYWQKDAANRDGYEPYLPSVTDFPLYFAMTQAFAEEGGWDTGLARIYNTLSRDFVYPDPYNNLIFLDNHDLTRFFLSCGKNVKQLKLALAFLLTTRGIPQIYYGTELLMDGDGGYHPNVRLDFPGGWPNDKKNAFAREGRTSVENEVFEHMRTLLQWRKVTPPVQQGKLVHYIPENNVYVYFRIKDEKTVMVILNGGKEKARLPMSRFAENIRHHTSAKDIITGSQVSLQQPIEIGAEEALVLELQ
jgi:neopullulanase